MFHLRQALMLGVALTQTLACSAESEDVGGSPSQAAGGGGYAGSAGSSAGEDSGTAGSFPSAGSGSVALDAGAPPDAQADSNEAAPPDAQADSSEAAPPEPEPLFCEEWKTLFNNVNPGHCDGPPTGDACAEQSQTTFTLKKHSLVHAIRTYVGKNGMSGKSFGYTVSKGGTKILSGTMSLLGCTDGTEWCFFGDEQVQQELEPGSYVLKVAWPRICANPVSGCQGFVQVRGCVEAE